MAVLVVTSIARRIDGSFAIATAPGYETLGWYLRSDLFGVVSGPFPEVYAASLRGADCVEDDGVTANGFTVRVEGLETLVEDDYSDEVLRMPTASYKEMLDLYAACVTDGAWQPVPWPRPSGLAAEDEGRR